MTTGPLTAEHLPAGTAGPYRVEPRPAGGILAFLVVDTNGTPTGAAAAHDHDLLPVVDRLNAAWATLSTAEQAARKGHDLASPGDDAQAKGAGVGGEGGRGDVSDVPLPPSTLCGNSLGDVGGSDDSVKKLHIFSDVGDIGDISMEVGGLSGSGEGENSLRKAEVPEVFGEKDLYYSDLCGLFERLVRGVWF